jgi:signal transduction histidine kinase
LQKKFQRIHLKDYLPLLLLVSVSIVVWFVSAPVYRFSGAIIWLFLIIALLMFFEWITINYSSQTAWTTSILLLLFMFFLLPNGLSRDFSFSTLGTVEPEMQIAQRNQPIEKIVVKTTTSGLQVNIPGDGEACWDLPLPCTTPNDFLAQLQLFDAKDMAKGFFIPLENK